MTLLLISLLVFLIIGLPVAYSLGLSAFVYFVVVQPDLLHVLPQRLYSGMESYELIALPLFILMGQVMNEGGITQRLIRFCLMFVGRFRGGLGLVNVGSSMLFGGISGSSSSDTASIGSVLIPEMQKRGYPKDFATGLTVASSTMGMIIPPSVPMILFAVTAQISVGKLFLAGVVPGILVGVFQLGLTLWLAHRKGFPKETATFSASLLVRSLYILIMPLFVVGVVVLGIATATESAGLGVLYAILVGFFLTRRLKLKQFYKVLRASILTSAMIMMIIAFLPGIYLGACLGTGARGGGKPGRRKRPGTSITPCHYHRHYTDRRNYYRCQPSHPVAYPGFSSGYHSGRHFSHSIWSDPGNRSGRRRMHTPCGKLPQCGCHRFRIENRHHLPRRPSFLISQLVGARSVCDLSGARTLAALPSNGRVMRYYRMRNIGMAGDAGVMSLK